MPPVSACNYSLHPTARSGRLGTLKKRPTHEKHRYKMTLRQSRSIVHDFWQICNLFLLFFLAFNRASAQPVVTDGAGVAVPQYFDPHRHRAKPDFYALRRLRFITSADDPPFHFALPDGTLTGFDIDLARHICAELKVTCTIQMRRPDTAAAALAQGSADALLTARPINALDRKAFDVTAPYYRQPARFLGRRGATPGSISPHALAGRMVGVLANSPYAAFLARYFPEARPRLFHSSANMLNALHNGDVDLVFGDAIGLSFWLNGDLAQHCCSFVGGPYLAPAYFGEGVGIAVAKGNMPIKRALDYALERIAHDGTYTDLYLKYFPVGYF